jgi:hypothetical protein
VARLIGIVMIFSIVGPAALATLISLIMVAFGAALLQLVLIFVGPETLRPAMVVAVGLLAFVAALASFLPSVVAGLIFASVAVYAGMNTVWMAWAAAAVAIVGFIALGFFIIPTESSAVILPSVDSPRQAAALFAMLSGLAILPTTLCWWLAKPLHRATIAA